MVSRVVELLFTPPPYAHLSYLNLFLKFSRKVIAQSLTCSKRKTIQKCCRKTRLWFDRKLCGQKIAWSLLTSGEKVAACIVCVNKKSFWE